MAKLETILPPKRGEHIYKIRGTQPNEPYYTGSHKVLIDLLQSTFETDGFPNKIHIEVMSGKKWHWRARTSALHMAQVIPKEDGFVYGSLLTSSVLPLHELLALRPELQKTRKVIYFHENQLVYPVRKSKERDFQYGYNQILSCLTADVIIFNSEFNMTSFLSNLRPFFKLQPDYRPKNLLETIETKCKVLYFPVDFQSIQCLQSSPSDLGDPIRIVWPHRWEFDKNPEMFFRVIRQLISSGATHFRLSILGENFTDNPAVFQEAGSELKDYILHWGYLPSKSEYFKVLSESDIVVSTSDHEFFGVAMLEAVYCGCYPLCPKALVYPEIYAGCNECLYDSEEALLRELNSIISNPKTFRCSRKNVCKVDFNRFDWQYLKSKFVQELIC